MIFSEREIDLKTLEDEKQDRDIYENKEAIESIQSTVTETVEKVDEAVDKVDEAVGKVEEAVDKVEEVEEQIESISSSVSTNTSNISTLQSSVGTNTSNISTLQSNVSTNASNISALQTSVGTNTSNISTLQNSVSTNASSISTLQGNRLMLDASNIEENSTTPEDTDVIIAKGSTGNTHKKPFSALWNYIKSKCDAIFQPKLVSGENIKTINGSSLLEGGNIMLGDSTLPLGAGETITLTNNNGTLVISHTSGEGYKHIPSGGRSGKILGYSSPGTAAWLDPPSYNILKTTNRVANNETDEEYVVNGPGKDKANTNYVLCGDGTWNTTPVTAGDAITVNADSNGTVISHTSGEGYKHIPSGGTSGKILGYSSPGTAAWIYPPSYNILKTTSTASNNKTYEEYVVNGPGKDKANTNYVLCGDGTWQLAASTVLPVPTSADVGKTLKVNSNGEYYLA